MNATLVAKRQSEFLSKGSTSRPRSSFINRHPVVSYYILTFAISWGGILFVIGGPGGIPGTPEQINRLMPLAIPFMLLGPSVSSLLLTGLLDGKNGYRDLLARLRIWHVAAVWYGVAILTAPLVCTVVLLALSLSSPVFVPGINTSTDKAVALLTGISVPVVVGFLEELGWTGFAIPRLRLRHSVLATGLITGVLWGAWHILTNDLWGAGMTAGDVPLAVYMTVSGLSFLVGQLPAFRVLMVWVYDRTGSLLVAMLMHASLTASAFVLDPIGISGATLFTYGFALTLAWWGIVAILVLVRPGEFLRCEVGSAADDASQPIPGI